MKRIFVFLAAVIVLFLTLPLLKLILGVGFDSYMQTLKDTEVINSIFLTMKVSFLATLFVLFTGLPLAYLIARYEFFGKSLLESLIDIPTMVPHTAAGIALLMTFGSQNIQGFLESVGLGFIDSTTGIMAAMMFLSAPYLINSAKEGFKNVDVKLENISRSLGASQFETFMKIVIPNAKKDIINGMLMMWARGLGEFGAVVIIAYHPMIAPVLIYDRFINFGLNYSAPVAALMIIFSVIVFLSIRWLNNRCNK
ncbi:sulfate/molybdate ABC transporter, permease protein [Nautilia profundicola AmH]|uniref:Sulfate/molybdate ABC transporter, permease protein n=1 Tax=Nautilia profundicola (strain ATCC BAA-1463 / DSM 18972 / AmH) TaxID=598659 RepID=B9L5R7_NAUPA|nr:ABC transporter permease [Nautilia profundicola]ACM92549.1 sulfate/molybdate ABC transporter, permease protein [Nautilia profundicola AmH]